MKNLYVESQFWGFLRNMQMDANSYSLLMNKERIALLKKLGEGGGG